MSVRFSHKFDLDIKGITKKVSKGITKSALSAWSVAVRSTPAPPTPAIYGYKRSGRLRSGWKLKVGKPSGLIPAVGRYGKPSKPSFSFDIDKDKYISLFNNVPYAIFVEEGANSTPMKMMFKARINFVASLNRLLP